MRALFDELDKAASQSASIIAARVGKLATSAQRRAKKRPRQKRVNSYWSCLIVAFLIGIVAMGLQILSHDAIWSALNLPTLKYWYNYVPRDVLRFLVHLTGSPHLILVTGPFVYPVAAIGISFCVALAGGVGKKRIEAIVRLAGFAWDRNSFCRGWLITGTTGSGKTISAIVGQFHQVFRHEKGTLRDSWEGSDLEIKVEEIEKRYRQETDRIHSRISILREERGKLDEELEVAAQQSLMGDIQYQTMNSEERAEQAESIKSELNLQSDSSLDSATISIAAVQYQKLLQRAKSIEEEIGRIEWRELHPIKQQFNELMKRIEVAKYKSFPWGGLCIDEKGLFWQTLVPIARHYKREHHLMLLQTRPNWAPSEWKPQARFNVLSDRKIKTSTYAKAIVDTAGSIAGGHEESPFFKTQAQKWIEASIDLQWGARGRMQFSLA